MRWSNSVLFTLVLLLTVPGFAQPSLRDILQVGGVLQQRRGSSDLEQAIRLGGVIIQMSRRGDYQSRQPSYRVPQNPRYPEVRYPAPAPRTPQPPASVGGRPAGYDHIAVSGKSTRLDPSALPLTINPGNQYHYQTVQKAVELWNSAGQGELFRVTTGPADLTVDWTGSNVSAGSRAETRMKTSRRVVVPDSISVRSGNRDRYELARVMTHELGHVLGLDHSDYHGDIMYRSEQPGDLVLSERDVQMLHWLYSQHDFVPVVGATRTRTTVNGFALQPASFCPHDH